MSVNGSAHEINQGRGCTFNADMSRSYTRVFRVEVTSNFDGPLTAINANGIPARYSFYQTPTESDQYALCHSVDAHPEGDGMQTWLATCHYKTTVIPKNENPLQDPIKYKIGFDQFTRVAKTDVNGALIANGLGDLFIPPVTIDDSRPIFTVTRNEPSVDLAFLADMKDSVNANPIWGLDEREIKVKSIQCSENQIRNGVAFYTVTYEFAIQIGTDDWGGWDVILVNQGFRYKNASGVIVSKPQGDPVTINLSTGQTFDPEVDDELDAIVPYRIYKERDFTLFGF